MRDRPFGVGLCFVRQIYRDTVSPLPEAIRYACDFAGPDLLLIATDHPRVDPKLIVANIQSLALPVQEEGKVFGENARRLFRGEPDTAPVA